MIKRCLVLLLLLLAGCQTCRTPVYVRQPDTNDPWNTNYLLDASPGTVTMAEVHSHATTLTGHYWTYSQVDGVLWPAWRTDASKTNPDRYIGGGDSGLYTGQALAAFCFDYGTTKSGASLNRVKETLRGLYILTHATGTPGIVARNAFPADQAAKFGYPDEWGHRIEGGFAAIGPAIPDPFGGAAIPPHGYYTRGTKDQLTGMVLGLAAVWSVLDPADVPPPHAAEAAQLRALAKQIADALHAQLLLHNWRIRDQNGRNDTSADHVDQLLRAAFLSLVYNMGNTAVEDQYKDTLDGFIDLSNTLAYADRFSNFSQYYAHNLRVSRALTIWLLEGAGSDEGKAMATYVERNVWRFTNGHKSAWFAYVRRALTPSDSAAAAEGLLSLKSLSLKPIRMWASPLHGQEQKPNIVESLVCHRRFILDPHLRKPEDYSTWQKEPWDTGPGAPGGGWDKEGLGDASGLDFLLPYWLARFVGAL